MKCLGCFLRTMWPPPPNETGWGSPPTRVRRTAQFLRSGTRPSRRFHVKIAVIEPANPNTAPKMAFTTALGESGCSGTAAVSITFTLPPCKTRKSSVGAQSNSVLQRVAASSGSPDDTEMRKFLYDRRLPCATFRAALPGNAFPRPAQNLLQCAVALQNDGTGANQFSGGVHISGVQFTGVLLRIVYVEGGGRRIGGRDAIRGNPIDPCGTKQHTQEPDWAAASDQTQQRP